MLPDGRRRRKRCKKFSRKVQAHFSRHKMDGLAAAPARHPDVPSTLRLALQVCEETCASLHRVVELLEQMLDLHQTPSAPVKRPWGAPDQNCPENGLILKAR